MSIKKSEKVYFSELSKIQGKVSSTLGVPFEILCGLNDDDIVENDMYRIFDDVIEVRELNFDVEK